MKKNYIMILFVWLIIIYKSQSFQTVSAQEQIAYDCEIWWKRWEDLEKNLKDYFDNAKVLKKDHVKMAYLNLKSYCCAKWILDSNSDKCSWAKDSSDSDFPESPYMSDQLIDVWFKTLDWDPDLNYWLPIDNMWQTYRKAVRDLAKKAEWVKPQQFLDIYNQYWDPKESDPEKSLPAKYRQVCEESYNINMNLFKMYSSDMKEDNSYKCSQSAESRINKESTYLQSISAEKAVKYYEDNLQSYFEEYFEKTRFPYLLEKLQKINWDAWVVDRKATPAVETASGW